LTPTELSIVLVAIRAVVTVRIAHGTSAMIRNQKSNLPTIDRRAVIGGVGFCPRLMAWLPAGARGR
jgi:hypothetical protein